jgi:hypothetical protein
MIIYVLKCEKDKYYVGKTNRDVETRFLEHIEGKSAMWTRLYKPISIHEIFYNCDEFDEDKYTKMYMARYGIPNVRGGSYCQLELSQQVQDVINREITASQNKCYHCNETGHYIQHCPLKKYQVIHEKDIKKIPQVSNIPPHEQFKRIIESAFVNKYCLRCGRNNHDIKECYAKVKKDGTIL